MDKYETYIGTKIVKATQMDRHTFLFEQHRSSVNEDNCSGYKVLYEDGYESWSPKATFEAAYRLMSGREKKLINVVDNKE